VLGSLLGSEEGELVVESPHRRAGFTLNLG
jgi:hypothetical protein